jgi:hypothetical protein
MMTKDEAYAWRRDAERVYTYSDYGKCGNKYGYVVYRKDGKLWMLNTCNGHLTHTDTTEQRDENGRHIRDYSPRECEYYEEEVTETVFGYRPINTTPEEET